MKEKTTYCLKELKSLGWTPKVIEQLLPEPTLKKNPMYTCAAPMKCWNISDVEKAMETPEFIAHLEKHKQRQWASKKAVNTKKQKALDELEEIKKSIVIKQISEESLKQRTLQAKEDWYDENGNYEADPYKADEDTVNRWMVNYIRHNLTSYDDNLCKLYGKTGKEQLYRTLKNFILDKIAAQYPFLEYECYLQKERTYYESKTKEDFRKGTY